MSKDKAKSNIPTNKLGDYFKPEDLAKLQKSFEGK